MTEYALIEAGGSVHKLEKDLLHDRPDRSLCDQVRAAIAFREMVAIVKTAAVVMLGVLPGVWSRSIAVD